MTDFTYDFEGQSFTGKFADAGDKWVLMLDDAEHRANFQRPQPTIQKIAEFGSRDIERPLIPAIRAGIRNSRTDASRP